MKTAVCNPWVVVVALTLTGFASPITAVPLLRAPATDLDVQTDSPGAADFRKGIQALLKNDLTSARAAFARANKLSPKAAEPMLGLADVALRQGKAEDALGWLQNAKSAVPGNPAVWLGLGRYYRNQRNLALAEDNLRQATKLGIPNAPVHAELGDLLLEKGAAVDAVSEFRRAVAIRPNDPFSLYGLGVALSLTKQPNAAQAAFEKAARFAPGDVAPLQALARLFGEQSRFDQALKAIDQALKIAPNLIDLQKDRVDILAAKGQRTEALAASRKVVGSHPTSAAAQFQLGGLLLQANDLPAAEAAFRETFRLDPKHAMALNNAAFLTAQRKGDLNQALTWAKQASELEPRSTTILDTLAAVHQARGDNSAAMDAANRAVKIDPQFGEGFYRLGTLLARTGKRDEAVKAFNQALALRLPPQAAEDARRQLQQLQR